MTIFETLKNNSKATTSTVKAWKDYAAIVSGLVAAFAACKTEEAKVAFRKSCSSLYDAYNDNPNADTEEKALIFAACNGANVCHRPIARYKEYKAKAELYATMLKEIHGENPDTYVPVANKKDAEIAGLKAQLAKMEQMLLDLRKNK